RHHLNILCSLPPSSVLSSPLHDSSWYQENASRSDAQRSLISQPVGAFLIRGSQNAIPGNFSLSVRHSADVQHFKVLQDSRGQYYLWSETFPSLNKLVDYYKSTSISRTSHIFLQETQTKQREDSDNLPHLPAPVNTHPDRVPSPAPRQRKASPAVQVRALYDFQAEETDELEFSAGDIIEVLESSDQHWWKGRLRGKTGVFPSSYTKPI
uniref:Osteoclast-stimulating factor 1 n=1 Tax=Stegastes partitus TaxID=144197 RepID=A0A3B4ZFI7_9TELE